MGPISHKLLYLQKRSANCWIRAVACETVINYQGTWYIGWISLMAKGRRGRIGEERKAEGKE